MVCLSEKKKVSQWSLNEVITSIASFQRITYFRKENFIKISKCNQDLFFLNENLFASLLFFFIKEMRELNIKIPIKDQANILPEYLICNEKKREKK